jgi:hypothetical protein
MDFFQDYITINGQDYQCKIAQGGRTIFVPCQNDFYEKIKLSQTVLVNGFLFELLSFMVIDSMGFGGKDQLVKIKIIPVM